MKAEELMPNDFVLFDNRVCKIVATNAYRDCAELIDTSDEDNEVIGKYAKHIEPIPLTAEILEKNGFYVYNRDDYTDAKLNIYVDKDNLYQISVSRKSERFHIAIHYIKWFDHKRGSYDSHCMYSNGLFSDFKPLYVHELQHALRLCELTELANSFKVQ